MTMSLDEIRSAALKLSLAEQEELLASLSESTQQLTPAEKADVVAMCDGRWADMLSGQSKTVDALESLARLEKLHESRRPR
jgi:hypothetical protein